MWYYVRQAYFEFIFIYDPDTHYKEEPFVWLKMTLSLMTRPKIVILKPVVQYYDNKYAE